MPSPPLDIERLIEETFIAQFEYHPTLASTNDRAKQAAAEDTGPLPLLIVAEEQTAGRGRGAHRWWTGPGSLAFSLLVDPQKLRIGPPGRPLLALAAAVAVVDALEPLLPDHEVGVHWPNDVMASGRKLAGVLVETLRGLAVVGIGVNSNNVLADAPADLRSTATTLVELTGSRHDPTAVLVTLLRKLAEAFSLLAHDADRIARRAGDLCLQHGRTLTIESGGQRATGRCAGIAEDGALLLDTPSGRQGFYTGTLR